MGRIMNLNNPPEVADGGYWYVVPATPDPELGGQTPGDVPGTGWCAWYNNGFVAIRCPEAVAGLDQSAGKTVDAVLIGDGYTGKPHGRVGGR